MFEAIIQKDRLESLLEPVNAIVDECKIHLGGEAVSISAVDASNVALVDVQLDAAAFESYETDGGVIAVHLDRLEAVVANADAGALVKLRLNDETRKLQIAFGRVDFELALLDPDAVREEPDLPDLDLPATVGLEGRHLDQAVTLTGMVADHVELGVDATAGVFYASTAGDMDQVYIEHPGDELRTLSGGEARSLFSLNYLEDIESTIDKDAEVTLRLGEELPAEIGFQIAEAYGDCEFMLSPRVEAEG